MGGVNQDKMAKFKPTKQRRPPTIQATTLGSDWVLVVTCAWWFVGFV